MKTCWSCRGSSALAAMSAASTRDLRTSRCRVWTPCASTTMLENLSRSWVWRVSGSDTKSVSICWSFAYRANSYGIAVSTNNGQFPTLLSRKTWELYVHLPAPVDLRYRIYSSLCSQSKWKWCIHFVDEVSDVIRDDIGSKIYFLLLYMSILCCSSCLAARSACRSSDERSFCPHVQRLGGIFLERWHTCFWE